MTKEIKPPPAPLYSAEQSRRFVDLAFDCMFINAYEKEETLNRLKASTDEEDPSLDAVKIFQQEKLISDENIEFLIEFDAHLQTRNQDRLFGQLATANGMAPAKEIEKALEYQKTHFNQTGLSLTLGDILVNDGIISPEDRVSILLTQNRIDDAQLIDALNDLGKNQIQKDAVNKRFGVLAIKKEMVTREQVNEALARQKTLPPDNEGHGFIGRILQDIAGLSDKDILQVLEEQKQFEKRRLNLEKALYSVNSEIKISKKLNRFFEYTISRDGVEAFVTKKKQAEDPISVYEFLIWIKRMGIRFGIVNDALIQDFIQNREKEAKLIVARGNPATPPGDERLELNFRDDAAPDRSLAEDQNALPPTDPDDGSAQVQEETPRDLIKKGGILARIIPGQPGKTGKDVLGHTIHPTMPAVCRLIAGRGVMRKGLVFSALIDGHPVLKSGTTLVMEPEKETETSKTITGDLTNDTQNTYEQTALEIKGNISSQAVLRCHSLIVHGSLTGSVVCSGDIEVKGEIGTPENPKNDNAGHGPSILSIGSIQASKAIIGSRVQTFGSLSAFHSSVMGSDILAYKGMTIKNVIHLGDKPSTLQFGLKPGDKILGLDHETAEKKEALSVLRKEREIRELTLGYEQDLAAEEYHQTEQAILSNLMEILQAPELDPIEGLGAKIEHLYRLPEFSSIRTYYLKLPKTETARSFINSLITSTRKMTREDILDHIQKKIDPGPEEEDAVSGTHRIETEFRARLAGIDQEVDSRSDEIDMLVKEIKKLEDQRMEQAAVLTASIARSRAVIKIKNQCEQGTVIKGRIARLVIEQTVYHVKFKEIQDPKTQKVSIVIESY